MDSHSHLIAMSFALAGSVMAAGRLILNATKNVPAGNGAPAIPMVANNRIVPILPANPVLPVAPNNAVPPPPVVVPPAAVAVILASFASALGRLDALIHAMGEALLDISPLTPTPSHSPVRAARGIPELDITTRSDQALYTILVRLWNGARRRGAYRRSLPSFYVEDAVEEVMRRLHRVLNVVGVTDQSWAGKRGIVTSVLHTPVETKKYVCRRKHPTGAKIDDTYLESAGVRSDTLWVLNIVMIVESLSMRYGASVPQARYIGSSVAIDALLVSYGVDPRMGAAGVTAENFGIAMPDNLPRGFARA